MNNALKYEQCSDDFQCYLKLRRDLTKDNDSNRMKNLREYESKIDLKVVENTTFTTARTYISYGIEYKDEYQCLLSDDQYDHIVFTDREIFQTCNRFLKQLNLHKYMNSLIQLKLMSGKLLVLVSPVHASLVD